MTTSVKVAIVAEDGEVLDTFDVLAPMPLNVGTDREQQIALAGRVRGCLEEKFDIPD